MNTFKKLFMAGVFCAAAFNLHAGQLNTVNVNAPKINYLFSTNGTMLVKDTVFLFLTNLPPFSATNGPLVSGLLQSRTFQGRPGAPEAGLYAYVYRLALRNMANVQSVSIQSMTLNFSPYYMFNYGGGNNYQIFDVTSGGIGTVGVGSATVSGTRVTFNFSPALTFSAATPQPTTQFFGMISSKPPPSAANDWATLAGSVTLPDNTISTFNWIKVRARIP